jgi:hypothetical protein
MIVIEETPGGQPLSTGIPPFSNRVWSNRPTAFNPTFPLISLTFKKSRILNIS